MRRAANADGNQAKIMAELKKIGAKAVYIGTPLDLLVGFRGQTFLLEVKNPDALRGNWEALTDKEREFIATWPGHYAIVKSPEEAVSVVVEAARR